MDKKALTMKTTVIIIATMLAIILIMMIVFKIMESLK